MFKSSWTPRAATPLTEVMSNPGAMDIGTEGATVVIGCHRISWMSWGAPIIGGFIEVTIW